MKAVEDNKFFLVLMMLLSLLLASMAAHAAESELEVACRAKAKEAALQVYQGCITERGARLKEIREGYKAEIAEVKAKYDRMLKEAGTPAAVPSLKPAKTAHRATPVKAKSNRAEQPTSGIAQRLPPKQNRNGSAIPVQAVSEDQAVVAASNDEIPQIVPVSDLPSSDDTNF